MRRGAVRSLRTSRIGFLGTRIPECSTCTRNFTQVHAQTGAHVEVLEIDDLVERVESLPRRGLAQGDEIRATFDLADVGADPIADTITPEVFEWSARVAVGLDRLVEDFELDGLTYYYPRRRRAHRRAHRRRLDRRQLATDRTRRPGSGGGRPEDERGHAAARPPRRRRLLHRVLRARLRREFILMGHDGPGHLAIAEGRPVARALKLYHGKAGAGLSIEMKVRLGPVTIVGLTQTAEGRLKLVAAEGESIAGPTFRIGNTNSRIRFSSDPRTFFDAWCGEGPTHHVALGIGHQLSRVRRSPICSVSSSPSSVTLRNRFAPSWHKRGKRR